MQVKHTSTTDAMVADAVMPVVAAEVAFPGQGRHKMSAVFELLT